MDYYSNRSEVKYIWPLLMNSTPAGFKNIVDLSSVEKMKNHILHVQYKNASKVSYTENTIVSYDEIDQFINEESRNLKKYIKFLV